MSKIPLMFPPWLILAEQELGISEIKGSSYHNQRILEYHKTTELKANDDETPWCSSFVNWCIVNAALKGTNKAYARSWLMWGNKINIPAFGCVAVLSRTGNPAHGHVGFVVGMDDPEKILLLGGNQGDKVSVLSFPKSRLLGYRWP